MTIFELMELIQTNEKALKFFQRLRWKDGLSCPKCGLMKKDIERHSKTKLGYQRYRCFCGHVFSDTSKTAFHGKRMKARDWIFALYELSQNKGISSVELGQKLGMRQKKAWFLLTTLRKQCQVLMKPFEQMMMRGVVESDEAYLGLGDNATMVQGIVQRGKHAIIIPILDRTEKTLKGNIKRRVKKYAYVMTDTASAYFGLNCMGYEHFTLNHSKEEYSRGNGIHSNTIEGLWGNQKKILYGIHHGVSKKFLFHYVSEFLLKYNLKQAQFTFPSFLNLFFYPPLTC
jgi:transposase-like protein